jgi:hypothetical protein
MKINKKILYAIILLIVIYIFETIRQNYRIYKIEKEIEVSFDTTTKNSFMQEKDDENYQLITWTLKEIKKKKEFNYLFNFKVFPKIIPILYNEYVIDIDDYYTYLFKEENTSISGYIENIDLTFFNYEEMAKIKREKTLNTNEFLEMLSPAYLKEKPIIRKIVDNFGVQNYDKIIIMTMFDNKLNYVGSFYKINNKFYISDEDLKIINIKNTDSNIKNKYYDLVFKRDKDKGVLKFNYFAEIDSKKYNRIDKIEVIYQNNFDTKIKESYHYINEKFIGKHYYNEFGSRIDYEI